jgi:hypothetical protein
MKSPVYFGQAGVLGLRASEEAEPVELPIAVLPPNPPAAFAAERVASKEPATVVTDQAETTAAEVASVRCHHALHRIWMGMAFR